MSLNLILVVQLLRRSTNISRFDTIRESMRSFSLNEKLSIFDMILTHDEFDVSSFVFEREEVE